MKKLFVTLIALFSIGTFVAVADNDRIIAKESLPHAAQQFISSYFGDVNITYVSQWRRIKSNKRLTNSLEKSKARW